MRAFMHACVLPFGKNLRIKQSCVCVCPALWKVFENKTIVCVSCHFFKSVV